MSVSADVLFTGHRLGWPHETLAAMGRHLDNQQLEKALVRVFREKARDVAEICSLRLKHHEAASWLDRHHLREDLIKAAQNGNKVAVEIFLDVVQGDVNEMDSMGRTILSHAAECNQTELVKYLLSCVADSLIPDAEGRTAVFWAAKEGMSHPLELLIEATAPVTYEDIGIAREMGDGDCGLSRGTSNFPAPSPSIGR